MVPNSGTVTWKSERTSSRKASNSSSARSSSSISRTGAPRVAALQRLQERALEQEGGAEECLLRRLDLQVAGSFQQPNLEDLASVVPFVDCGVNVQSLIALEANQVAVQYGGQDLGDLGLADAGFAFQEEGAVQLEGQEERGGQGGRRCSADRRGWIGGGLSSRT